MKIESASHTQKEKIQRISKNVYNPRNRLNIDDGGIREIEDTFKELSSMPSEQ